MIGHDRLFSELQRLLKRSDADATSICAQTSRRRVMRFAYDAIHQDLVQESITVHFKVIRDKRVGVAATDTLDRTSLHRALHAALEIAGHAPPMKHLAALPGRFDLITSQDYTAETINIPAIDIVRMVKRLFQLAKGAGAQLAGSHVVGDDERAVVNSNGVRCYAASTVAGAKLVAMYRKLSGYGSVASRQLDGLDVDGLLERALKQCLVRHDPVTLPTGEYEVLLEPEAIAELIMWMGYIAFGAKSFQEHTSCFAGRLGEKIVGREVTIVDDGNDPSLLRMPFDFEGVPKQRVTLIDRGVAANIVYDTAYGALYGQPSTGHGLPPDEIDGPAPSHMLMQPGSKTRAELIRSCKRGLLIPRFHYVSGLLNPREALMTGLTREGAFLIEDGKLTRPLATMRFTQSLLEALQHVRGISKERQLVADPAQDFGCAVMPTVHLARFRFTGRSQ